MLQRAFSGIVYVVLVIGSLLAGKFVFGPVVMIIGMLAMYEFYRIADGRGMDLLKFTGICAGMLTMLMVFLVSAGLMSGDWLSLTGVLFLGLMVTGLFTVRNGRPGRIATVILGVLYIAVPLSLLTGIAFLPSPVPAYSPWIVLGIFILIWINDIMAYLVGIAIGRHRLFETISPKKSWEGAIGGTAFTFIAAFWMDDMMKVMTQGNWLVLAGIVSVFGVLGDLFESMYKRSADVKDSGRIIPGHGGILDRIDSLLFVAPVSFAYLWLQNL